MRDTDRVETQIAVNFIRKSWIHSQKAYHQRKMENFSLKNHIYEWTGWAVFFIAMCVAIIHAVCEFSNHGNHGANSFLADILSFFAIILPGLGAAIGAIRSHREYARIEKRSESMELALSELDERFSEISSHETLAELMKETDDLMLRETQDWLMLMKFAKLEPAA